MTQEITIQAIGLLVIAISTTGLLMYSCYVMLKGADKLTDFGKGKGND